MLSLSNKPTAVPDLYVAPAGTPLAGRVYVVKVESGKAVPQLPEGRDAVLLSDGGRLELVTCAQADGGMVRDGTYLDQTDFDRLTSKANPQLRLYGWSDTWGKVWSAQGALLLLTTLLGLVTAAAGLYFAIWGTQPASAASLADRARTGLEWTVEPADRFDSRTAGDGVANARRELHRRQVQTTRCLDRLAGRHVPAASVPGVSCEPSTPPWYRNTDSAAWVTLAVGFLTALLAVLGLRARFGFQKSPAGA